MRITPVISKRGSVWPGYALKAAVGLGLIAAIGSSTNCERKSLDCRLDAVPKIETVYCPEGEGSLERFVGEYNRGITNRQRLALVDYVLRQPHVRKAQEAYAAGVYPGPCLPVKVPVLDAPR